MLKRQVIIGTLLVSLLLWQSISCSRKPTPVNPQTSTPKLQLVLPDSIEPFKYNPAGTRSEELILPYAEHRLYPPLNEKEP